MVLDNSSSLIPSVVYDFSEPHVYDVDDNGTLFSSQVASNNLAVCSQDSLNIQKGKSIAISDSDDDLDTGSYDAEFDIRDFADSVEIRMKEKAEVDEILEEMRKQKEDPMTHCEGDTDIEDLFVCADEPAAETHSKPEKRVKLPVKRKGPTERSHSSVVIVDEPDFIPSNDEEKMSSFLPDYDDDGFEPLSMVPPEGRKSRAKKRPPFFDSDINYLIIQQGFSLVQIVRRLCYQSNGPICSPRFFF